MTDNIKKDAQNLAQLLLKHRTLQCKAQNEFEWTREATLCDTYLSNLRDLGLSAIVSVTAQTAEVIAL